MSLVTARFGALLFAVVVVGCGADDAASSGDAGDDGASSDGGNEPCGRDTTLCADGRTCDGAADCASGNCRDGTCHGVSPANGVKDGDETDVDCGGKSSPACPDGEHCAVKDDCVSGVCTGGVCQAPSPTDGVENGDETDVDCGGAKAPKCAVGKGCKADTDCNAVKCDPATKKCAPPSYSDGIKNGDETDVDCGGGSPTKCAVGKACLTTKDCDAVLCDTAATKKCLPPTKSDGLKNGTETDVDCGGGAPTNAPACAVGKSCLVGTDCTANACNYANKCVEAPSCAVHYGGDTCGKGEVGQAGAQHESCCASVALPGGSSRVDKYEITAGRMREFIRAVNNDVQGWVNAHRAITQDIADGMVQYLPQSLSTPTHDITRCDSKGENCTTVTQSFGVYEHLGNTVFMPDRPCPNCGQGCWVGSAAGQNGHPTYWWDAATQSAQWSAAARVNTQVELDVKSLNCTAQLLFAAFCAWDGGRLPTQAELGGVAGSNTSAWGSARFPWGDTPVSNDTLAGAAGRIPYTYEQTAPTATLFLVPMLATNGTYNPAAAELNTTNWNPFAGPQVYQARYVYPVPANVATTDQVYGVAAPGRMRNDFHHVGPGTNDGFYDVAANIMEVTSTGTGPDDVEHNQWPTVYWVGGSFEGHPVENRKGYDMSVLTKYGKQGARCARKL